MDRQQPAGISKEHRQIQNASVGSQKKDFKLLVDPQLKKGQEKLVRFDGELYSCTNHGQGPVIVRDPRAHTTRLWARRMKAELPVPRYKVDEWYIGAVPPREVTFSKLNDNTTKQFMEQLCAKFGKLERVRVYHHPKTGKHMGLAKVVFSSIRSAAVCIERLHETSIMGNVIKAELDCKGELLKKLHHKIIRGEMVADTMPDVIKHTQEKPKARPHKIHAQRRKSSTDDPRRKSVESLDRRRSIEQSSASGPKTPPMDIKPPQAMEARVPPVPQIPVHSSHDNHGSHHSPHFCKGPGLNDMPNPHSLESGYGSHPGSASLMSGQTSPFGAPTSNQQEPTPEMEELTLRDQKDKFQKPDYEHKVKTTPVWSKDLVHRIESLINEQNEKYNLGAPKSRLSESDKTEDDKDTPTPEEEVKEEPKAQIKVAREKTPEDLEDGECSDGAEESSPALNQTTPISSDEMETEPPLTKNPPSPREEVSENSRQRFSRSPSPSYHYPPKRSPSVLERHVFEPRHNRFSPPPEEFYRRMRHPSPGRPPAEYNDRNYHPYGARPHSPPFGLHRRHSPPPFDGHRRISRSPGFEHHRHHYSPPRRRPLSPGYIRHHEMRHGHPEYLRRRSPSPIFSHHRRSPSPGPKFSAPLLRREFDYSPRRERMYYSPREMERHHGGFSPRHLEHERHRKRSPGGHRSPEPSQLREHRELPPEFRDRWSHHRSPSPHQQRPYNNSVRHHRHSHRSRSSSPDNLQTTPPRVRSPVRMHPDQRPYSPGDLPVGDLSKGAVLQTVSSETDSVEAGAIIPSKRKERDSSDDVPLISLDERLREITGEAPESTSPVESPKPMEEALDSSQHVSPTVSEDMDISSGGGESEHGDQGPPFKQHPHPDMGFRNGNFRPVFPGPHGQPWRPNGPGPHMMWNEYNPRFHVNQHRPMWRGHGNNHMRFPHNMHNGFPQPMMNHPQMGRGGFNNQMLPPPPPGWDRPWVQDQTQFMNQAGEFEVEDLEPPTEEPACDATDVLSDRVLLKITEDLKQIIKRDLNKKVIETMAFKVYESWWDKEQALKNPKPTAPKQPPVSAIVKTEVGLEPNKDIKPDPEAKTVHGKMPALLNTFDPLNWAKGSLEMDGFRIGLGFRSAISKMPSFRVKKRTPSPTLDRRSKLDSVYRKNKAEKEKPEAPRKRVWLDSEGEEEDESEQESSDEEEDQREAKSRVLHVEDVFSSSSSEEEDSDKSSGEEEEESEEESEEEQEMEEEKVSNKRSISLDEHAGPPKKRYKLDARSDSDSIEGTIKSEKIDERISEAAVSLSELQSGGKFNSASLLSPPPGSNLSDKDLRRIHPKKRYRVLSKDETHNLDLIAEVSNRLRSDDELSLMSDKEKAALEVLQEMKSTPERRISSTNRLSESSDSMDNLPPHPITPGRQHGEGVFSPGVDRRSSSLDSAPISDSHLAPGNKSTSLPPLFNEAKQSGDDELEAVEALLSIKKSQPPIPPLSPQSSVKQNQDLSPRVKTKTKQYDISQKDREIMELLAEEHNYFASKRRETRIPEFDPLVLRIAEEHAYSCPPSEEPKPLHDKDRYNRAAKYEFSPPGEPLSASTAERVKLRRGSKSKRVVDDDVTMKETKARPTYAKYKSRSKEEELGLLYHMWTTGLDLEDMRYLRYEYEQMLTQSNVPQWANDTHWTAHPITNIPNPDASPSSKRGRRKRNKKVEQNAPKVHDTGCARSEGYYKVAAKTKLIQRRLMYRQADNTEPPATSKAGKSTASSSGTTAGTENSREARHMMRRIASEFGSDASDLLKYNQLMFRKKSVKFKRSRIHGWGLFAQETIGADEMVIEYVGQLVRSLVADRREVDYTKRGIGSSYLFRIDSDHIIDATKCGNYARFMNHSCDPSCYAKIITVEGTKKIVIYSKNVIKPSEEITYDYKFPIEDDKIPCFCGAINCRGTLN